MAKADYLISDQWGLRWLVRPGDSAHRLLQSLPKEVRAQAVLPRHRILDGSSCVSDHEDLIAARARLERLGKYALTDEDDAIGQAVVRTLQLVQTLEALEAVAGGPEVSSD